MSQRPTPTLANNQRTLLPQSLSTSIPALSKTPLSSLLTLHPEFTTTSRPPQPLLPPCTTKVLQTPLSQLTALKTRLTTHTHSKPTTNTLLTALLWSAVTRARRHRNPDHQQHTTRLMTAVDGRRHLDYWGNLVWHCVAELPPSFFSPDTSDLASLEAVCDAVAASTARAREEGWAHFAETHCLVERAGDYRRLRYAWDGGLFVSSWANMGVYGVEFGAGLGRPEAVRVRHRAGDGFCVILPRRRGGGEEEVLEAVLGLREDHLEALGRDDVWRGLQCC